MFSRGMGLPSRFLCGQSWRDYKMVCCAPLDQEKKARGTAIRMEVEEGRSENIAASFSDFQAAPPSSSLLVGSGSHKATLRML